MCRAVPAGQLCVLLLSDVAPRRRCPHCTHARGPFVRCHVDECAVCVLGLRSSRWRMARPTDPSPVDCVGREAPVLCSVCREVEGDVCATARSLSHFDSNLRVDTNHSTAVNLLGARRTAPARLHRDSSAVLRRTLIHVKRESDIDIPRPAGSIASPDALGTARLACTRLRSDSAHNPMPDSAHSPMRLAHPLCLSPWSGAISRSHAHSVLRR